MTRLPPPRQRQIVNLIGQGLTTKAIARSLNCSGTELVLVVQHHQHLAQPAAQALIAQIREDYQLAYQQLPDLAWL